MGETAFLYEDVVIFQIQVAKRLDAVPYARDYFQERDARLKAAETATQGGHAVAVPALHQATAGQNLHYVTVEP